MTRELRSCRQGLFSAKLTSRDNDIAWLNPLSFNDKAVTLITWRKAEIDACVKKDSEMCQTLGGFADKHPCFQEWGTVKDQLS